MSSLLFAGGDGPRTVLSTAKNALLPFLTMVDATALRSTCSEARDAIRAFPFDELRSWVPGRVTAWRAVFPAARALSLRYKADLCDADFAACAALRRVELYGAELKGACVGPSFRHLTATALDVSHVVTLRAAAFEHLGAVRVLKAAWCRQRELDDACLARLASVEELDITHCWNARFTDAGLRALAARGTLRKVALGGCTQAGLTDAGVAALLAAGTVEELDVSACRQLTDAAFAGELEAPTGRLRALDVSFCTGVTVELIAALRERGVAVSRRRNERDVVSG